MKVLEREIASLEEGLMDKVAENRLAISRILQSIFSRGVLLSFADETSCWLCAVVHSASCEEHRLFSFPKLLINIDFLELLRRRLGLGI